MNNPFRRKASHRPADEHLRLEIHTRTSERDKMRVLLGGHDITQSLQGVEFKMGVDGLANVTLRAIAVANVVEVDTKKVKVVQKTIQADKPNPGLPEFEVLIKREEHS